MNWRKELLEASYGAEAAPGEVHHVIPVQEAEVVIQKLLGYLHLDILTTCEQYADKHGYCIDTVKLNQTFHKYLNEN